MLCKDCRHLNLIDNMYFCNILFKRFVAGKCMSDEIYVNPNSSCKIICNTVKCEK